jgi:hypothetical protein
LSPELVVQPIQHRPGRREQVGVVARSGQTAYERIEAARLGSVVPAVFEVDLMDDPTQPIERGIVQVVDGEKRLERAATAVM